MDNSTPSKPEVIFVFGVYTDQQTTRDFAINLVNWSKNNPGVPLRVNINSGGGNILDSLFLFEEFGRLRLAGHRITIAVYGRCASCAGWLIQAADRRIIGKNSWIQIHEVSSAVDGTLSKIRQELARCEELQNQTIGILTSRSKLTAKEIHDNIDGGRDWWIGAQEALEKGLVDEIEEVPGFQTTTLAPVSQT